MKGFYYDTLLDEENICNLGREKRLLLDGISAGKKLVVYGPRNFGKTSLVKNVVMPSFRRKQKKCFILFADLMEVKTLAAIHQRIRAGFEQAFAHAFPQKNILETAKRFLKNLRPQMSLDPLTGQPSLSLISDASGGGPHFTEVFSMIRQKIAPEMPVLIVLDEFQDIAFVPEAQGLFRQAFQEFKNKPMIVMGSKRHILSKIFSVPSAPLASFGEDIEFKPIPYEEYHRYILERFEERQLDMRPDDSKELQDALFRIPEAINIVCAHLFSKFQDRTLGRDEVFLAIEEVVEGRASRFEELLSLLSEKEEEVMVELARQSTVKSPMGRDFLKAVSVSHRSVKLIFERFMDRSLIDKTPEGYRVADPMMFYYLRKFR